MKLSACSMPAIAVAHARRGQPGAAVGAVDVHPHVELGAHLGDAGEVVDDTGVRRARRGDDRRTPGRDRRSARPATVSRSAAPHIRPCSSAGTSDDVGVHRPRRRGDAGVGAACRSATARGCGRARRRRGAPPEAGSDQRAEVAGRAAADEHAAGRRRAARRGRRCSAAPRSRRTPRRHPPATSRRRCSTRRRRGRTGSTPRSARRARTTRTADGRSRCTPGRARRRRCAAPRGRRCPVAVIVWPAMARSSAAGRGLVERRRVHAHPLDGVAHDRLRQAPRSTES